MSKLSLILSGTVSALAVAASLAGIGATPAAAAAAVTTPIYGGGSTLAELYYRQIFSCYGNNSALAPQFLGSLPASCTGTSTPPYNGTAEVLYAGSGSGGGTSAFDTQDKSFAGKTMDPLPLPYSGDFNSSGNAFYGTNAINATYVPTANTNEYPVIHYGASDYSLVASDVAAASPTAFGGAVQFPTLVTAIVLPFTPASGTWTPNGVAVTGSTSQVNLSTNTVCGIFTGQITNWNDAHIKADNQNTQLGSGQITVVYRSDGSGTSFIFSNSLLTQCAKTSFPVPAQWVTDQGAPGGSGTATNGANQKFFLNVVSHGHIPAGAVFTGGNGSTGVQLAIDGTAGAIGYLSPNFVLPVLTGNDSNGNPIAATANVQTVASLLAQVAKPTKPPATLWVAHNAPSSNLIMKTSYDATFGDAKPKAAPVKAALFTANSCVAGNSTGVAPHVLSSDGICADNPLNWGITNATPATKGAYPFGGFSFHYLYRCYATSTEYTALAGVTKGSLGLWRWYFGSASENSSVVANTTLANGFSTVPTPFVSSIKKLLTTNKPTEISYHGNTKAETKGVPVCNAGPV